MTIVDKDTFNNLVKNPNELGTDNIPQLEATIKAFPYCQINYSLLAKASSISGTEELEKAKPLAAAYALSRIALQNLVEGHERYDNSVNIEEIVASKDQLLVEPTEDILEKLTEQEPVDLSLLRSEEQKRQQQIIQGFMKKNPRIIRQESNVEPVTIDVAGRVAQSGTGMIETEAFAKILLRQGKIEKAIDLYQKLILRNPEKRNYFAKKLSELNRSGK
jgi:tetratricopeptide (TPR) repeat protein